MCHPWGMSSSFARKPNLPWYLTAPRPAHFRLRTDLLEELALAEAFEQTLPRTREAHARWLAQLGRTEKELPFEGIQPFVGRAYEPTPRYIFHPAVFPASDWIFSVVTDARGWSVGCEPGGLYDAVIKRAAEFVASYGCEFPKALAAFYPRCGAALRSGPRHGIWRIGYERATGLATILWPNHNETKEGYLTGRSDYTVPNFDELNQTPSCGHES